MTAAGFCANMTRSAFNVPRANVSAPGTACNRLRGENVADGTMCVRLAGKDTPYCSARSSVIRSTVWPRRCKASLSACAGNRCPPVPPAHKMNYAMNCLRRAGSTSGDQPLCRFQRQAFACPRSKPRPRRRLRAVCRVRPNKTPAVRPTESSDDPP